MAVFSKYFLENELEDSGLPEVDVESIVDDDTIEAAWEESSIETAARIVAETNINYNRIMEACAIMELNFLEENGREFIYEADGTGFFEKVKDFFRSIWNKIQSLFKKAITQFNSWFASDKEFLRKYKKDLNNSMNSNGSFSDKEIDIFPYLYLTKGVDVFSKIASSAEEVEEEAGLKETEILKIIYDHNLDVAELDKFVEKLDSDHVNGTVEKFRAKFVSEIDGKSREKLTSKEFSDELAEALQGGESGKISEPLSKCISPAMKFLEDSDKIKKSINDAMKYIKKGIDNAIKSTEKLQKGYADSMKAGSEDKNKIAGIKHTICSKHLNFLKDCKTSTTTAQGIALNTLKACSRQCKAVCVKALTYTKPKNESAAFEESATGLLGSINLI